MQWTRVDSEGPALPIYQMVGPGDTKKDMSPGSSVNLLSWGRESMSLRVGKPLFTLHKVH
jgi:hypothetical protein